MTRLYIATLCILLSSCDRPECHNTNPIFDKYKPDAKEYKAELIKQLKLAGTKKLSYWIYNYVRENDRDYILINIQNDKLCAIGMLHFTDAATDLKQLKKVKGASYSGAELAGLKYKIVEDSGRNELEFISVSDIID